jgi:hypothetical protein
MIAPKRLSSRASDHAEQIILREFRDNLARTDPNTFFEMPTLLDGRRFSKSVTPIRFDAILLQN